MAHILVVDDDIVSRRIMKHVLSKAGHTIQLASSADDAMRYALATQFDMAILDISMPEVDGIELLEMLREQPAYDNCPIVMLTASSQDEDRIRSHEAGANRYMTKPASSAEVIATVKSLLG